MSRPQISLENYEQVYEFYQDYEQNQRFAKLAHFVMGALFRPSVSFEDGSDGASVAEVFAENEQHIIIAANHLSNFDPPVLLSLAQREKALRPLIGHTSIPTKAPISTQPWYKGGPALRWTVDNLGSIPLYRKKDLVKQAAKDSGYTSVPGKTLKIPRAVEDLKNKALIRADEAQVTKLKRPGQHGAGFPEGERNTVNHRVVQELRPGFAKTVCSVASEVPMFVLPVGLYYRGEPKNYKKGDVPHLLTPNIHVGLPMLVEADTKPDDFNAILRPILQGCVDVAVNSPRD